MYYSIYCTKNQYESGGVLQKLCVHIDFSNERAV